jgi:DNA-binding GntR family transcriptional regulator
MPSGITRAESVAEKLRQAIRAGAYVSGERLLELNLAERLQVSQNTIRDALRMLEAQGWVVRNPRRGVYVRDFTREEAAELFTLWEALEVLALPWAIQRLTRKEQTLLEKIIQVAQRDLLDGEMEESSEGIFRFHAVLRELSGQPHTRELLTTIQNRIYLLELLRQRRTQRSIAAQEQRLLSYQQWIMLMAARQVTDSLELARTLIRSEGQMLAQALE